jgi:Asp-tRNA(Asn)/Glu-tRNA(Gln) amidotransferase A subunit family amidase
MVHQLTMAEMVAAVRSKTLSQRELWDAHIHQIDRLNGHVNAFMKVFRDFHPEEAIGPLAGIPVTVKDSLDVAGEPTACGSKLRALHRAGADAAVVARLRAAGARIIGKTNVPEFLANYETDNHLAGRTNNPWNLDRVPGGSSGGEAAAIAACMSAGGVGSDGGGSIRWPAHCCGIAGLKPTPGRISGAGHYPGIGHPGGLLGVVGPMARTVEDVRLLFNVLAGYDTQDPFAAPVEIRDLGLCDRVGVLESWPGTPVQPAIRAAVRECVRHLGTLGIECEEYNADGIEKAPNVWSFFFSELPAQFTAQLIGGREDDTHWTGTEFLLQALERPVPSSRDVVEKLTLRDAMRARVLRYMEKVPVMLWPAAGIEAFPHRQRRYETEGKEIGQFQAILPLTAVNLLGLPALALPILMTESDHGMPVGVQLVGRPWEEERLLALGAAIEKARGPFPLPPIVNHRA